MNQFELRRRVQNAILKLGITFFFFFTFIDYTKNVMIRKWQEPCDTQF